VTGIGLVTPLGVGTSVAWEGLIAGRSGVGPLTKIDPSDYPSRIAAEVHDFDPHQFLDRRDIRRTDTFIQYALASSQFALEESGLSIDDSNADRVGVAIGCGIGGLPLIENMKEVLVEKGPSRVSPFFIPGLIGNMAAGMVSIHFGARGPNACPCTACTTGLHAVGDAFRLIQHGYADAMFAGGTESVMTPLAVAGFCSMRALSTRNDEPERASRPFDRDRDGFVIGEGAGVLMLEELEQAKGRQAQVYAELVGYGMGADAHHISAPHPEGEGAVRVMEAALEDAEVEPEAIDYINAHGTATPLGDIAEVKAIKQTFGDHAHRLAISSTKSATGHLLGAAGGVEAAVLALTIHHGKLPPTINLDNPDSQCDLDFVPNVARDADIEYALTNSFGFGGTNGALIMKKHPG
jgi:3-oxoacyl-[acyl-carrier-protein] synthase II